MSVLLRRAIMASLALGAALLAPSLAVAAMAGPSPSAALLRVADEGWRDACEAAARSRGWRVRDIDRPSYFEGGGGRYDVPMRVRDGDGDSFDAVCMIGGDGSIQLVRRKRR